jgi:hypothetical protein
MILKSKLLKYSIPALSTDDEFNFSDSDLNKATAEKALASKTMDLPEFNPDPDKYECVIARPDSKSVIALINKQTKETVYYVELEKDTVDMKSVTQVKVWRHMIDSGVDGMAARVFDYLVEKFGTIVSDDIQTQLGKRFWIKRMVEADSKGYEVGLINTELNTTDWKQEESIQKWIQDRENAWGWDLYHLRFVIKKL